MINAETFGQELANIVKAATAPLIVQNKVLLQRLDALEKRIGGQPAPRDGADGKDADPEAVAALVHERIKGQLDAMSEVVNAIPEAPELPDIPAMVAECVAEAVAAIPAAENGADGKGVQIEDVLPSLEAQVAKFLADIPLPKDGAPGAHGKDGKDGDPGPKGEKGADGIGLAGAIIDRDGQLAVTLTNGEVKTLGPVIGKDGAPGRDGSDGANGIGFEDLSFEIADAGRPVAKFQRGDVVKTIALPGIIDRGTFTEGEIYDKGDAVTWGGSLWIAQENGLKEKPEAVKGWRLAVKKGRDGRDTEAKKVL